MRRSPGVIPPGKAAIFVLAAALVPVVLKEAKPLVRAVGRGLRKLGDMVDKLVTTSESEESSAATSSSTPSPEPDPVKQTEKGAEPAPKKASAKKPTNKTTSKKKKVSEPKP